MVCKKNYRTVLTIIWRFVNLVKLHLDWIPGELGFS